MKLFVASMFVAAGIACCGLGGSPETAAPAPGSPPPPSATPAPPAASEPAESVPVRPPRPATPPASRPAVTHPPLRTLGWQVYSAEAHSHTIWLAEGTGAVDPMDRNFGELVRDDVDRWIFAKDGRFVLVEMSADVLLLDVVHGTASSLPALEGGIEYGFDATDTVLAATWTAPPDTMCEGKAAGCKLEAGRWSCGTPVATCGADWDPGCDCAAWSGRPAWNDVRRGSKINRCGEELGEDASPEVIASFPTPVGYDWRVVGGAAPWAYRRGRGDCGEYVVAPVLMYDGTTWFDAFPDVPTDQNVELDVEGPWMLRYVSNGNPVYDLGSTDPLKTVITLDQGVLWPESVPVPPYQPVAEPVETEPTRTTSERPRPHPRDRPRPRPAHPRREH